MDNPLIHFAVGLIVCFLGTIPLGPINLTVVKTTLDYDSRRGMEIALAAALVEIAQALVAISFGMMISAYLDSNRITKFMLAAVFVVLAIVVYTRKTDPKLGVSTAAQRAFLFRGLWLAALNPQAVPFWIFALAAISQYTVFHYNGVSLVGFLAGVFLGKLLALLGFVYASSYLRTHLRQSSRFVNHALAGILLFIGVSQLWNAF